MRGGRIAIAVVAVALLGLVDAGGALACSCLRSTPAESLARSDAAIVGRLLAVEPRGAGQAVYRYRVLRVFRGARQIERGSSLAVHGNRGGAACGLPERTGARLGLFLERARGRWSGSLCGTVSPRRLREAAQGTRAAASADPDCAG
ncbi:MAG TPA: hypothetical protein VFY48_00045 [Solirubrobacterales bacterium]|nr:hypothetical protein [Solirubrobacterales bacterium]